MLAARMLLAAVSAALGEVPQNKQAYTYTITGFDQTPYLTRTLLPRMGERRLMFHRIWRADADEHLHNHPWKYASFRIVSGGYVEERLGNALDERVVTRYRPGDVNRLTKDTFHRISYVEPYTWTIGLIGPREQSWGFLVDGEVVEFGQYFARKGHVAKFGSAS